MSPEANAMQKKMREVLTKAFERAEKRARENGPLDPNSPADRAIAELRRDRILTPEELDRPCTI